MVTEAEFETDPDAVAGRKLVETRLERLSNADLQAFWEAVRRCYASTSDDSD